MNKTARRDYNRYFLLPAIPETLTVSGPHLQILDNYIFNTRLRLRIVRNPGDSARQRSLEQRIWETDHSNVISETNAIQLDEAEHAQFRILEGREIRKNRYRSEAAGNKFHVDIYLGDLRGLIRASFSFDDLAAALAFEPPLAEYLDISEDSFFRDEQIVDKALSDVLSKAAGSLS
jgi:CYTH domain-containing protein